MEIGGRCVCLFHSYITILFFIMRRFDEVKGPLWHNGRPLEMHPLEVSSTPESFSPSHRAQPTQHRSGRMEEALDGPPPCQSLHEAVAKLDKRSVAWFLQRQGDSVMQRDDDMRTPLLLAAAAGDCTTCTLLIRRMAAYDADSINWPDASGLTPLHWACTQQRVDAVALLLHHAAAVTQQGQSSRLAVPEVCSRTSSGSA